MLTAAVLDELQVTEASCCVLLSLNVPVAVKRCAPSRGTVGLLGLNEMERRFGGVSVAGSYSSALAEALDPRPPAISTRPLSSSVAVSRQRRLFRLPVGVKVPAVGS